MNALRRVTAVMSASVLKSTDVGLAVCEIRDSRAVRTKNAVLKTRMQSVAHPSTYALPVNTAFWSPRLKALIPDHPDHAFHVHDGGLHAAQVPLGSALALQLPFSLNRVLPKVYLCNIKRPAFDRILTNIYKTTYKVLKKVYTKTMQVKELILVILIKMSLNFLLYISINNRRNK